MKTTKDFFEEIQTEKDAKVYRRGERLRVLSLLIIIFIVYSFIGYQLTEETIIQNPAYETYQNK